MALYKFSVYENKMSNLRIFLVRNQREGGCRGGRLGRIHRGSTSPEDSSPDRRSTRADEAAGCYWDWHVSTTNRQQ